MNVSFRISMIISALKKKFTTNPPGARLLVLRLNVGSGWRMVATTLSKDTRRHPWPCSANDAAAIALTAPKALRPKRCPPHRKSVNGNTDIFLPETRGDLMMEERRAWRTD